MYYIIPSYISIQELTYIMEIYYTRLNNIFKFAIFQLVPGKCSWRSSYPMWSTNTALNALSGGEIFINVIYIDLRSSFIRVSRSGGEIFIN